MYRITDDENSKNNTVGNEECEIANEWVANAIDNRTEPFYKKMELNQRSEVNCWTHDWKKTSQPDKAISALEENRIASA